MNVSKTELTLSKSKMKKLNFDVKLKLNDKRIYPNKSVQYLDIKADEKLGWIDHVNDIAIKLNRANAVLFKVREFPNVKILKPIYYGIPDYHLNYANTVWGQYRTSMNRLSILQKNSLYYGF